MWVAFFLGRYKCCTEALHDMDLDEDVRDLSGRGCDTPYSQFHNEKMNCPH
jgi:hypothetical protein